MTHRLLPRSLLMRVTLGLGVAVATTANAGGDLGITLGNGPDNYSSRSAALSLWSGDGSFNMGLSRRMSESGEGSLNDTEENHAMLGLKLDNDIGLSGSYTANDEPTLEIETVGGGVSLPLDRAQSARLFLDYRVATYTGKGPLRRQLARDEYALGLSVAANERLTVGGSYSQYRYNRDTAPLTTLFQQRRLLNLSTTSVLLDLLDYGWTVNADMRLSENESLGLFYSRAHDLLGEQSTVVSVSSRMRLAERWSLGISGNRVQGSGDGSRDSYYDMALHYSFN